MTKIAIIGVGYSDWYEARNPERPQYYELTFMASKRALEEAGISRDKVDIFIEGGVDWVNGRLISNMHTTSAMGTYLGDESQAAEDGLLALIYACLKIKAGAGEIAIVTSTYGGDSDLIFTSNTVFDPFIYRPLGMTYLHSLALQASSYKLKFNVNEESAAAVVVKNRENGSKNPRAYLKRKITVEEVMNSEYEIWPLRSLMIPKPIAGAVAIILASEEVARRYAKEPIWIEDIKWITDNYYLGSKELYYLASLNFIAKKVYDKLNINNPLRQIDAFEIADVTPYHELMVCEALELTEIGQASKHVSDLQNINLSGGTICTDLSIASGLFKVGEAYYQLIGKEPYKLNINKVLVHSMSYHAGASAQTHAILVLSK
jgi:acetyl-CoA C-acetyltransferase